MLGTTRPPVQTTISWLRDQKWCTNVPLDSSNLQVYVNGALRGSSRGRGPLDDFWGYKACLGSFDLGGRYLRGFVDDFYIFNYAIQPDQIKDLLRIKCPGKSWRWMKKKKKTHSCCSCCFQEPVAKLKSTMVHVSFRVKSILHQKCSQKNIKCSNQCNISKVLPSGAKNLNPAYIYTITKSSISAGQKELARLFREHSYGALICDKWDSFHNFITRKVTRLV